MISDRISTAQNGDNEALLELIKQFTPLLKKYSYLLHTEDAFSDLLLEFIQLIWSLDLELLTSKCDGVMITYIARTIYSKFLKLSKQIRADSQNVSWDSLSNYQQGVLKSQGNILNEEDKFLELIPDGVLSLNEKSVIIQIFLYGYSAAEIAHQRGVSRQAINQIKHRALTKLSNIYIKK